MLIFAENRKATFEYEIHQEFDCGIELLGNEVKSIRARRLNIANAYVFVEKEELFITNAHIAKYQFAFKDSDKNYIETRKRKLLLKRSEIRKLSGTLTKKGYTVIPLKCYQKGNKIKLKIGLCSGKTMYDKRESIKQRDAEREARKSKNE